MVTQIAIVDDDAEFGTELADYLDGNGCEARCFSSSEELMAALPRAAPDMVILDQRLGPESGTEVLKRLRAASAVPCIILTGAVDEVDRIVCLEVGADDYVQKTAHPREILARIRAVLRRAGQAGPGPELPALAARPAGWELCETRRELFRPDGTPCRLSTAEFEVLRLLAAEPGNPVSRETLHQATFGRPLRAGDRAVDSVVYKLRRKIGEDLGEHEVIKGVRQVGYVFTGFPPAA